MTPGWTRTALTFALALPLAAHAVDLTRLDEGMSGPRTRILVLGTVHLSEQPPFPPEALDPVLDRLAAYKPGYITIEDISGEQCDMAARHPTVYRPPARRLAHHAHARATPPARQPVPCRRRSRLGLRAMAAPARGRTAGRRRAGRGRDPRPAVGDP